MKINDEWKIAGHNLWRIAKATHNLWRIAKATAVQRPELSRVLVTHEALYASDGVVLVRVPCETGLAEGQHGLIDPVSHEATRYADADAELRFPLAALGDVRRVRSLTTAPIRCDAMGAREVLRALITLRCKRMVLSRDEAGAVWADAAGYDELDPPIAARIAFGSSTGEIGEAHIDPAVLLPVMQACAGHVVMYVDSWQDGYYVQADNEVEAVVMPLRPLEEA